MAAEEPQAWGCTESDLPTVAPNSAEDQVMVQVLAVAAVAEIEAGVGRPLYVFVIKSVTIRIA